MKPRTYALATSLLVAIAVTAPAGATPLYTAAGGQVSIGCPDPEQPGTFTSATPGVTVSDSAGDPFRSWYAQANQHSLHARSRASGNWTVCPLSTASFVIDDLYFAHPTLDFIDVSFDVHYEGTLSTSIFRSNSAASARVKNDVRLDGVQGTNVSGFRTGNWLWRSVCGFSGCDGAISIDEVLTHAWTQVPTNRLLRFDFGLLTEASIVRNFGAAGTADANFSNSSTFANPLAVFDVPDGTSVSSTQLALADNSIVVQDADASVPAPASGVLLALGLPALALASRRARASVRR